MQAEFSSSNQMHEVYLSQVQNKTLGTAPLWMYGAARTTASSEVCPNLQEITNIFAR